VELSSWYFGLIFTERNIVKTEKNTPENYGIDFSEGLRVK